MSEPLTLAELKELEALPAWRGAWPETVYPKLLRCVRELIALRERRTVDGRILVLVEEFEAGMRLAPPGESPQTLTSRYERLWEAVVAAIEEIANANSGAYGPGEGILRAALAGGGAVS